jgi:cytochrome c oxidase assembly protein subunit 11
MRRRGASPAFALPFPPGVPVAPKGNGLHGFNSRKATVLGVLIILMGMTGLVSYAPTLYRLFCQATGYGGTVRRAEAVEIPAASDQTVTVRFDANVHPGLNWEFRPEQLQVTTHYGQPTKAYYYAKNNTDKTIVARAVFNVTPYQAAPYFFKIECFCFTEERLAPGESARMPLVFYVDEQMMKDKDTKDLHNVTLSYTFFKQDNLTPEQVKAARDLGSGSKALDASLRKSGAEDFDNDAPRR